MNDKSFQDYTDSEKLDVLLEAVANTTLFLMEKYPDYVKQVDEIREKHNKQLVEKLSTELTHEILKKFKGEE